MTIKSTIIVIEDEKTIGEFIETTLKAHDYKVFTAASGQEGLSLITSGLPDLILLDLGLPDIDGIEIIKQVRSWSMLPIIVISARTQEQEKVLALDKNLYLITNLLIDFDSIFLFSLQNNIFL